MVGVQSLILEGMKNEEDSRVPLNSLFHVFKQSSVENFMELSLNYHLNPCGLTQKRIRSLGVSRWMSIEELSNIS